MSEKEKGNPTSILSEYIAGARYEDIPYDLREDVKIYILDSLGCSIGGLVLKPGKIILDLFEGLGGAAESTVHATGKRIPCVHAAYVNSALANTLDFDDTLIDKAVGHPGATVVHPAIAVAEKVGAGGREIINAVLLGYEISVRVLNALAPTPDRHRQVSGLATYQIFGALTASCALLGLNADQIASAFGLGGFCAPVPSSRKLGTDQRPINWLKNNFGWAAMGGVLSALQVAAGFQGCTDILDGKKGFWVMAGSDRCDFNGITEGLGEHYQLKKISFKPYASCRFTHTTLDAVREIKVKNDISPQDIAKIKVETFYEAYEFKTYRCATVTDAHFSLPHLIALELLGRSPSRGLSEDDLEDEDVVEIAGLVSLELDSKADKLFTEQHLMPSYVTIVMKDGRVFSGSVDVPRGDIRKPLSKEEIKEKFRHIVGPLLGRKETEKIIEDCEHLDKLTGPLRTSAPSVRMAELNLRDRNPK